MAYKHNDPLHKHQKRASKLRRVAILFSVLIFIGVGAIAVDWFINQISNTETIVSSENTKTVQSANISVYRSKYFQFQATEDWVEVDDLSSENRFVYYKKNDQQVTQRFVVEVNKTPIDKETDYKITHVLPVELTADGLIQGENKLSDHCINGWPEGIPGSSLRIEYNDVSFVCTPKAAQYNIIIGEKGSDEALEFTLDDGREVTLTLTYSDLTAYPSAGDVYNIVSSFTVL